MDELVVPKLLLIKLLMVVVVLDVVLKKSTAPCNISDDAFDASVNEFDAAFKLDVISSNDILADAGADTKDGIAELTE